MDQLIGSVKAVIVGLFALVVRALDAVDHAVRSGLAQAGVVGTAQSAVLLVVWVLLIVLAFRLLGRVFAVLIAVLLVLMLLHGVAGVGR